MRKERVPPKDGWTVTAVAFNPSGFLPGGDFTAKMEAISGAWHLSLLCETDVEFAYGVLMEIWRDRDEWHLDDLLAWFRLADVPFTFDFRRDIFWEVME